MSVFVVLSLGIQQLSYLNDSMLLENIEISCEKDAESEQESQDTELNLDSDKYFNKSNTSNYISNLSQIGSISELHSYRPPYADSFDPPPEA